MSTVQSLEATDPVQFHVWLQKQAKRVIKLGYCGIDASDTTRVKFEMYVKAENHGVIANVRDLYASKHNHHMVDDSYVIDYYEIAALSYRELTFTNELQWKSLQLTTVKAADGLLIRAFNYPFGIQYKAIIEVGMEPNGDIYVLMPTGEALERELAFHLTIRLKRYRLGPTSN